MLSFSVGLNLSPTETADDYLQSLLGSEDPQAARGAGGTCGVHAWGALVDPVVDKGIYIFWIHRYEVSLYS